MENLLSKRSENLGPYSKYVRIIFIGTAGFALILSLYLFLFNNSNLDNKNIFESVIKRIKRIETALGKKNFDYRKRAEMVFNQYRSKNLLHSHKGLKSKEALIFEQNGKIKDYFGEVYYFRYSNLEIGEWAFIEKNKEIYFTQRMEDHVFYVRHFCRQEDNLFLKQMNYKFPVRELKYSKITLLNYENKYQYDNIKDMFIYHHLLKHSNSQLLLHLRFSKKDFEIYYERKEKIFLCSTILLFLLMGTFYFYSIKSIFAQILWLASLVDLFFLLSMLGEKNLYLKMGNITFNSLYQILIFLVFLISVIYFMRKRFKIRVISYILFNVFLVIIIKVCDSIFKAVNFNYLDFSLNYLSLITVILLLHILPLLFIRGIADEFYRGLKSRKQKMNYSMIYLLLQTAIVLSVYLVFKINFMTILILSVISFILLFFKRNLLPRLIVIFLLSISIYSLVSDYSLNEEKEFIANNLKKIFFNQGNYAKFIAREIIFEINSSSSDFYEFFQGNVDTRLESLWRKTIASREGIASGIFIVSKENEVLSHFAYQIPFLEVKTRITYPFWAMEDTTAELYGKEIPLASASISIVRESESIGRIIVQVLNSPELLLRYQEKVNIFTLNNKIHGGDLSYIKLNEKNQIVENPSNINLENITGILKKSDEWIKFKYMDLAFKGYIFRHGGDTFIIFFPANTLFKKLSEVIKIFLFFSFFYLLFCVKKLKKFEWKSIYYSFSIRVFSFLILISFLTAILFSIFFINFSSQTSEQRVMRMMYESGRTAQNIGYNMIETGGEFSKSHLLSLAEILNGDVSIYENGELLDTSNIRKYINSQIPVYLHSQILTRLNKKNQKFVVIEDEKAFHLFYKIYDYIFMVEFSNKWEKALSGERYYTDFIITLFFILIIIGFSVALIFRNKILSPIDGLNKGMAEVEKGNLPRLKNIPSEIEIKSLYEGFNSMIEGIREQKKNISEISRMKTIIKLGRRVAHEVKNPLTPIKLSAEQILRSLEDKNPDYEKIIRQSINYIIDEAEHLRKVSYGFLDLSRLEEINPEEFDLMTLIWEEMFNVRQIYSHIDFSFEVDSEDEKIKVKLDKIKIKQVLKNLINNSIEAIGEKKGEIRLILKHNVNRVFIEVADNGIGLDEKALDLIYNIDYSTKDVGTGLGLFIVKRIIELHKGSVKIESEKNKGTRIMVELPVKIE